MTVPSQSRKDYVCVLLCIMYACLSAALLSSSGSKHSLHRMSISVLYTIYYCCSKFLLH